MQCAMYTVVVCLIDQQDLVVKGDKGWRESAKQSEKRFRFQMKIHVSLC